MKIETLPHLKHRMSANVDVTDRHNREVKTMKKLTGLLTAGAIALASTQAMATEVSRGGDISACGTLITEPGQYRVTQDLYCGPGQQGIEVLSSKVTVDLRGHTIFCDAPSSEGPVGAVLVGDYFNPGLVLEKVRVKNGTVSGCDDGVIYFFTESGTITNITSIDNPGGGITLIAAQNTIVRKNVGFGNFDAIRSFGGTNNKFKHNWSTGSLNSSFTIDDGETGSKLLCNTSEQDAYGIAVGPFSSGNSIRGNYINNPLVEGITMYGLVLPDGVVLPVPSDNTIVKNIAEGGGGADLAEYIFDLRTFEVIVDDQCQNTWKKNQYVTWLGPEDCVAPPVFLDDDDVCALDDDDNDD